MGDLSCFISQLTPAARQDFWPDTPAVVFSNSTVPIPTRKSVRSGARELRRVALTITNQLELRQVLIHLPREIHDKRVETTVRLTHKISNNSVPLHNMLQHSNLRRKLLLEPPHSRNRNEASFLEMSRSFRDLAGPFRDVNRPFLDISLPRLDIARRLRDFARPLRDIVELLRDMSGRLLDITARRLGVIRTLLGLARRFVALAA